MDHFQKIIRALVTIAFLAYASHAPSKESKVAVSGFGLFGNAELRNALRLLEIEEGELTAAKADDAAFLLLTRLTQNGYLDASITATYETTSGTKGEAAWTSPYEPQLPNDVVISSLRFQIEEGILYYYENVRFTGLKSLTEKEASAYFIPDGALYVRRKDKSYSPSILNNQKKQLAATLSSLGRTDAKINTVEVIKDDATGATQVELQVEEGPLYRIGTVTVQHDAETAASQIELDSENTLYTRSWVEDQTKALRNESYRLGYPDTKVSSTISGSLPENGEVRVDINFVVERGPKITLSAVEHQVSEKVHLPMLQRKADLKTGVPLDLSEVEAARRRLSGLGIFNRIDLSYEEDGEEARKAVFDYTKGERQTIQLLVGYGSYESFRAGVIAERENLFGRAHSLSVEAIRSVKSLSGEISYSVPEILGEGIDGRLEASYLDRQELFFDRKERGVSVGLSTRLPKLKTDLGLDYAFEQKSSSEPQFAEDLGLEESDIGSLSFRATRSTLDNILYPTSGYELSGAIRYAADELGGETEYLKPELGGAIHFEIGDRWIVHVSTKAGLVNSPGINSGKIIPNDRILVGGENSVRGYRRGEAGPIDATTGVPTPAEAYGQFNLELEYPLFDKLNLVMFADAVRVWQSSDDFDLYEDLGSIGLGLRYNTIVGPVRLEYGHNIDPRGEDPDGTVHLSVGFPF